jgi:hypothetical protein
MIWPRVTLKFIAPTLTAEVADDTANRRPRNKVNPRETAPLTPRITDLLLLKVERLALKTLDQRLCYRHKSSALGTTRSTLSLTARS